MAAKKTRAPKTGAAPGRGLEGWPEDKLPPPASDLKPTMGRPRSSRERPSLLALSPHDFGQMIKAELEARGMAADRLAMDAHHLAMVAKGLLPFDEPPAVPDLAAFVQQLTTPAIGPSAPLFLDTDKMPPTPLGWLSLVALLVELRERLHKGEPVKAVHLAAGSGRSMASCRLKLGNFRTIEAPSARAWLQMVTGRAWE